MLISIIAAIDRRGLIGDANGLPWHLPGDLRRFRTLTWGKPIIMGRRTFELLGKPLPGRCNIVLSHDKDYSPPDCRVVRTLHGALDTAEDYLASAGGDEVMIIGGSKVYADFIQRWDRIYLTMVEGQFTGTAYFPVQELLRQKWRPARAPELHLPDDKNPHGHSLHILERVWETTFQDLQPGECKLNPGILDPDSAIEVLDLDAILARGTIES